MATRAAVGTLRRRFSSARRATPAGVGYSDLRRDTWDPCKPPASGWLVDVGHPRRQRFGDESTFGERWEARRSFSSSSAASTSGRDVCKDPHDTASSSSSKTGAPDGPSDGLSSVWNLAGFLKENRRVADICVTTALLMAGHSCVAPVLPLFADEFGATAAQVGMTLSAFAAARLVLNVPCGVIADRHGRKPLIVAGPLITAVGMMGSAACTGLPELFFWRFIAGAGSAVYMAGAQALLADASTPANRARVLGANQAAVLAGAAVGPALGGLMSGVMELGVRSPFVAVGMTCALAGWHAARTVPETLKSRGGSNEQVRDDGPQAEREVFELAATGDVGVASSAGGGVGLKKESVTDGGRMMALLSRRDFLAVSGLNAALFFSGAGGRATLLPLLAIQEHGYTPAGLGALFTAMAATSALGIGPGAVLGDRFGRAAVIAPCVAASSVAVAVVGTTHDPTVFLASSLAWAGAHSLMGPAPAAYAADVSPEQIRATALSTYRTFGDVGLLIGPIALGALADGVGVGPALAANGGVLAASALAFKASTRDSKPPIA